MHPYIAMEMARQRSGERLEAARKASLVKEVRKALRHRERERRRAGAGHG